MKEIRVPRVPEKKNSSRYGPGWAGVKAWRVPGKKYIVQAMVQVGLVLRLENSQDKKSILGNHELQFNNHEPAHAPIAVLQPHGVYYFDVMNLGKT